VSFLKKAKRTKLADDVNRKVHKQLLLLMNLFFKYGEHLTS